MEKPTSAIISEIACEIGCGNECYYHLTSKQLICIPNPDLLASADEEFYDNFYKSDIEKIASSRDKYLKFEVLTSHESFKIMEEFAHSLEDLAMKNKLIQILQQRHPFRHFKHTIDHSEFREDWFAFKQQFIEKLIIETFQMHTSSEE